MSVEAVNEALGVEVGPLGSRFDYSCISRCNSFLVQGRSKKSRDH